MDMEAVLDRPEIRRINAGAMAALTYFKNKILPALGAWITLHMLVPFYRLGTRVIARFVWGARVIGFDKIPAQGPALIISNHVSYVDGFLLYASSKRPIRFVIDADIFNWPGVHYFMVMSRAIPIAPHREGVARALAEISQALRNGELVGLFPEGYLTRTGSLGRFKPGVEWILKRDPVPVLPMAISGMWGSVFSRKYWKRYFPWWPRHWWGTRITLICGDPLAPQDASVNRLQREVMKLKYLASEPQ